MVDFSSLVQQSEQHVEELMALGGPVMWPLLGVSVLLWTLILERYWFLLATLPKRAGHGELSRGDAASRLTIGAETRLALRRTLPLIRTLSAILPMLGLLGTVTGIVETFDLIRLFGIAEPRIVAHGVSQALITTLTGLIMGLFGVTLGHHLHRLARDAERNLPTAPSRR